MPIRSASSTDYDKEFEAYSFTDDGRRIEFGTPEYEAHMRQVRATLKARGLQTGPTAPIAQPQQRGLPELRDILNLVRTGVLTLGGLK